MPSEEYNDLRCDSIRIIPLNDNRNLFKQKLLLSLSLLFRHANCCHTGSNASTTVRLVTSAGAPRGYAAEGRVQLLYNGTWKAICDDHWGMLDALVICRMLCFKYASKHMSLMSAKYNQHAAILIRH